MIATPDTLAANDAYLETQVLTASPIQLRLMLIEGAQRFARLASDAYAAGRKQDGQICTSRCQQVLMELLGSLQPKGNPVAQNLVGIYGFLVRSASEAILLEEPHRLDEICQVLAEEQTTWRMLLERDHAPEDRLGDGKREVATLTAPVERFVIDM